MLPVILFHAGFGLFAGGFVGVDVFFVISGYLITGILAQELEQGRYSIISFYERRVRRILPALFTVMLASVALALCLLTPRDIDYFAKSMVATGLFSSNVLFFSESGYFDTTAELKPLLHTWSLAVEEQYYILFPLLLALVWRKGRRFTVGVLAVLLLVSLALSVLTTGTHPTAAFYLLHTRAWELLAGALTVLLVTPTVISRLSLTWRNVLSVAGMTLVALSVFSFDRHTPMPGIHAMVPTLGAVLILAFGTAGTWMARVLSLRPFVWCGLLSYSLYLWHQPLLVAAKYPFLREPPLWAIWLAIGASLPLAYLSWRFVEKPLRGKQWFKGRAVVAYTACFATVIPLGIGLVAWNRHNDSPVINAERAGYQRFMYARKYCPTPLESAQCPKHPGKVLVVGDSMWLDAVNTLWTVYPMAYDTSELGGCPPHDNIAPLMKPDHPMESKRACLALNAQRFSQNLTGYDAVVIIARYGWYKPQDLVPYLRYVKSQGVRKIMVFGSYPALDHNADRLMAFYGGANGLDTQLRQGKHVKHLDLDDALFADLQRQYGFTFVSPRRSGACTARGCTYVFDGQPFTYDEHHWTLGFTRKLAADNKGLILNFFSAPTPVQH